MGQELHPRTAVLNKTQKNKSKKARNDALLWLAETFPQAFDNRLKIRPLKIGIMQDILHWADKASEVGISNTKLREAVVLFTRRIDYLTCLKAREMRIDLEGNPTTLVTDEEAERAAIKIKKRIEKGARNARKSVSNKSSTRAIPTTHLPESSSYFPERPPAFSAQNPITPSNANVIVKHKSAKQFDPDAIARLKDRLKEKLGLSNREETPN